MNRGHGSDSSLSALLIPVILLVGVYLILNGHTTPGGGFQGGAALSAALICRYLVLPTQDIDMERMQTLEKALYLILALCACLYILGGVVGEYPRFYAAYLVGMNLLIGVKVFCGLTVVFYRFVFYEDQ